MKEFIIVGLSVVLLSAFSNTATAMRAFRYAADDGADTQKTTVDDADATTVDDADETIPTNVDEECSLLPIIVYDQPPEDDEHWPGCRE